MNATSLYVSTNRLVMKCSAEDRSSWSDLYRLVPYLRQSLSCAVCGELLREPWTPSDAQCQHHVCCACRGGRKKLKPSCGFCRDYNTYEENVDLRILLQCYKRMCEYLMISDVYSSLENDEEAAAAAAAAADGGAGLVDLIKEGAAFSDNYKSTAGLTKSAYSILPCVYTNSASTQTAGAAADGSAASAAGTATAGSARSGGEGSPGREGSSKGLSNGSSLYSVMYAGTGNKITIKRKALEESEAAEKEASPPQETSSSSQLTFKKPVYRSRTSASSKRKGCRCGNATATPGKLTCCGQRCPCYVESKPCVECKCKGCRNPHRADGMKVRPHLVHVSVENVQSTLSSQQGSPSCSGSLDGMDGEQLTIEAMEEALSFDVKPSNIKVYSSQLKEVSPSLPAAIMMDEEENSSSGDGEVDCEGDDGTGDDGTGEEGEGEGDEGEGDEADPDSDWNLRSPSPTESKYDPDLDQDNEQDINSDVEVDV